VIADVETLGARRAIEQAARLGGSALAFGVEQRGGIYYKLFDDDGKRLSSPRQISSSEAVIDFAGKSDIDVAKAVSNFQREESNANAQKLLELQRTYGTQFASEARRQLEAIDPTGYANRERLGALVRDTQFEMAGGGPSFTQTGFGPQYEMSGSGPALGRTDSGVGLERAGGGPVFTSQNYGPRLATGSEMEGGGAAAIGRAEVERQLGEALFNEGKLSVEEERRLNNAVRAGQVARGNTQGNAPLAQEILARSGAETERARQARADVVGYLGSGQSSYDVARAIRQEANQLAQQGYINYATALGVNNQLIQQEYQNTRSALDQRNTASQQELANRMAATSANNQASQQEFLNQQTVLGQRNQAQQAMYANQMGAIAQNNQLAQQAYANQLGAIQQRNAATQQRLANLQSYAGLQPIVTQGGQLGALGQGAAPMMQTPIPQGVNINPQAGQVGTDFALGVYGNQTRQYDAQLGYLASTYASSQQNSPLNYITGIGGLIPKFI
jgi:hypothetical protein